jgi:hypothetical protein
MQCNKVTGVVRGMNLVNQMSRCWGCARFGYDIKPNFIQNHHHHHMVVQPNSGPGLPCCGFLTVHFLQGWIVSPAPNPQPGGPGLRIYDPRREGGPAIPPRHWVPILVAFYDMHGLQWECSLIPATTRDSFRIADLLYCSSASLSFPFLSLPSHFSYRIAFSGCCKLSAWCSCDCWI